MTTIFNVFLLHLSWSQIPSIFTFSIGSQVLIGGAGIVGGGNVQDVVSLSGPFSADASPVSGGGKANYCIIE